MNNVNKTLYIPLYGKAFVSKKGILLSDRKAESIWEKEQFPIRGKSKSKWLAYYMGMRAAVFDAWVKEKMGLYPNAQVVHIGCGMDSRAERVGHEGHLWFDVDFPDVIRERRRYYRETDAYRMIPSDARDPQWLEEIKKGQDTLLLMEGISMYLKKEELLALLARLTGHLGRICLLCDTYTLMAARISKYKNPINDVGVSTVYGVDDARELEQDTGLSFVQEHSMTPPHLIHQLKGMEKILFSKVFAGHVSKKLYRLYEYGNASPFFPFPG